MRHIAVLKPHYLDLILDGRKTIESRLSRVRALPFGKVAPGDIIDLKQTGGPVRARAIAGRIWHFDHLCPSQIDMLARRFERRVQAGPDFWRARRNAKVACFIELTRVVPVTDAPSVPRSYGSGWMILPPHTLTHPPITAHPDALRRTA